MIRKIARASPPTLVILVLLSGTPSATPAQDMRRSALDRALREFDPARRTALLLPILDPQLGPADSTWVTAVQLLAHTLAQQGQNSLSDLWFRWATRAAGELEIDTVQFLPELERAYQNAAQFVQRSVTPSDSLVSTSWRWPVQFIGQATGRMLLARTSVPRDARVLVEGFESIAPSEGIDLPAGSHTLLATAFGHDTIRIVREALPEITTVLHVDLPSLFRPELRAERLTRMLRVRALRLGTQKCGGGFFLDTSGLAITSYSVIRDAREIEVRAADPAIAVTGIRIAAHSPERDLAVLAIPDFSLGPLPSAESITAGQPAWSLDYPGCNEPAAVELTQVTAWDQAAGLIRLARPIPDESQGGALLDSQGTLLGLITDANSAVPVSTMQNLLETAKQNLIAGNLRTPLELAEREAGVRPEVKTRGGFPWKWAAAGVAAAGTVAAILLSGSGDGDGDNGNGTGIIITVPNR